MTAKLTHRPAESVIYRQFRWGFLIMVSAGVLLGPRATFADLILPGNEHPHGLAVTVDWHHTGAPGGAIGDPNTHNHQHFNHRALGVNHGDGVFFAVAAWVNRGGRTQYHDRGLPADRNAFGHGYIADRVEYWFDPAFPAPNDDFRQRVRDAFAEWVARARAAMTRADRVIGIGFEVHPGAVAPVGVEFVKVRFYDFGAGNAKKGVYNCRRRGGATTCVLDFNTRADIPWHVGAGAPPAGKLDFLTAARHETGHVVGLDHTSDNPLVAGNSIMRGQPPALGVRVAIDDGSVQGAVALYSQSICGLEGQRALSASCGAPDFGDNPDSYRTTLAMDGPRYQEGVEQRFGLQWDGEDDGQPTFFADGDDLSLLGGAPSPVDDEDGVIFGPSFVDVILNITRPNPNDYLVRAWWDTNRNGCFEHRTADSCNEGSELYIDELFRLEPGIYKKHYDLGFDPTQFYSRFRLTWDPSDLDVQPFREYVSRADGVSHGEVEDYVPEPTTLPLLSLGVLGLLSKAFVRRRNRPSRPEPL